MKRARSPIGTAGLIAGLALIIIALVVPTTSLASKPIDGQHKVVVCHATNSNTNPYAVVDVDVASAGENVSGHNDHTGPVWDPTLKAQHISWGDIIPAYTYGDFQFPGLNWTADGKKIWNAGCTVVQPSPSPSEKPSVSPSTEPENPSSSPTQKPSHKPSATPSGEVEGATGTPSAKPSEEVEGISGEPATGNPNRTPPPTDAVGSGTNGGGSAWILVIGGLAALSVSLLLRSPAKRADR